MKKIIIILLSLSIFLFLGCSDDKGEKIDNSGSVKISSFTIDGAKELTFNENKGIIRAIFPSTTDLTQLEPKVTLPDGASIVSPEKPEGPIDLSKETTYRIVNGNLYHDYKVLASHVNAQIISFAIGKYKGNINHQTRTITVPYPENESVTDLTPTFSITNGATLVSPTETSLDFTNPIKFELTLYDETFIYEATIVPAKLLPIAFVGEAQAPSGVKEADNKAAWNWLDGTFVEPQYISLDEIKEGLDLSNFGVIWYHHDDNGLSIPNAALNVDVVNALKAYHQNGGGLFLSGSAITLGTQLEISKDGVMFNNEWGWTNNSSAIGDNWGMRIVKTDHPIFQGLRQEIGESDRFYLQSKGVNCKGHNAIWNFESWTGYDFNVPAWTEKNGGFQLATRIEDEAMNMNATIAEYNYTDGRGKVITIAHESYDWYNEDNSIENEYKDNLSTLTNNILNYLSK